MYIRQGSNEAQSMVMLSAAKHLAAKRESPFAALRVTVEGPTGGQINSSMRIIGPRRIFPFPDYVDNDHMRVPTPIGDKED